jgi:hypothetical protein
VRENLARSYGFDGRIAAFEREILLITDSTQSAVSENSSIPAASNAQVIDDTTAAAVDVAASTNSDANEPNDEELQ